jgi:hypothetical protein
LVNFHFHRSEISRRSEVLYVQYKKICVSRTNRRQFSFTGVVVEDRACTPFGCASLPLACDLVVPDGRVAWGVPKGSRRQVLEGQAPDGTLPGRQMEGCAGSVSVGWRRLMLSGRIESSLVCLWYKSVLRYLSR